MNKISIVNGKIDPKTIVETIRVLDPAHNEAYSKCDDISLARLWADTFRDVARYNVTSKSWYVYNGAIWENDIESMKTENFAKLFARSLLIYSLDLSNSDFTKSVAKLGERRKRVIMLQDARDLSYCSQNDFDRDPFLFNCLNYTIDLKTGEKREHRSGDMLSRVSNVVYDSEIKSEEFIRFMGEIMQGDQTKIDFLQRLLGYSLIGENSHEQAYFIYGSTTRNGKGTLCSTISHVMGSYAGNIQPESLATRERNSKSASGDIARLDGIRFLNCSEPPKRMKLDVALFKTLTGRDSITARFLYEREFEFTPVFKLFLNCNYLPLVMDDTLFSSDRVIVITFDRHFSDEERDPNLKNRLQSPENVSGIFNWLLEGLQKYYADGSTLIVPESIKQATTDYQRKSDKLENFMTDCMILKENSTILGNDVYLRFVQWCKENGYGIENKSNFFDLLRGKGLLSDTGTIAGKTKHNVVKGYAIEDPEIMEELPF